MIVPLEKVDVEAVADRYEREEVRFFVRLDPTNRGFRFLSLVGETRVEVPDGALHGDEADRASYGAAGRSKPCPTPLLPEARDLAEPMTRGVVRSGRWTPLDLEGTHEPAEYYLARWAALARGLAPGASSG